MNAHRKHHEAIQQNARDEWPADEQPLESRILDALTSEPAPLADIAARVGATHQQVHAALAILEQDGRIAATLDGWKLASKRYAIEATYKGETGRVDWNDMRAPYVTAGEGALFMNATAAEFEARILEADQADADPWDALTGIKVVEVVR